MAVWVTGPEILEHSGAYADPSAATPADSLWAELVAAAISGGFDHRLAGTAHGTTRELVLLEDRLYPDSATPTGVDTGSASVASQIITGIVGTITGARFYHPGVGCLPGDTHLYTLWSSGDKLAELVVPVADPAYVGWVEAALPAPVATVADGYYRPTVCYPTGNPYSDPPPATIAQHVTFDRAYAARPCSATQPGALEIGFAFLIDVVLEYLGEAPAPALPAELVVAALTAGVEAYKRREATFGLTGYVDLQGAAVRVARDYLEGVAPIVARYATVGIA